MAESNKSMEKELKEALKEEKEHLETVFRDTVEKLDKERERIAKELHKEYENAKKYVSSNPEVGVGSAFAGGILLGIIVAKIFKNNK